jgi:hypothetical protein
LNRKSKFKSVDSQFDRNKFNINYFKEPLSVFSGH